MVGKKPKTVKVSFAVYMRSNGDGSASPIFYANEELAEKAAEKDDERFGDDVTTMELEIDLATGKIVSGVKTKVEEDE